MRSAVISVSLILGALPFTHLLDLGYSFLSFEVWGASFLFFCAGVLLAALFARLRSLYVLTTFLLYAFASVYFFDTSALSPFFLISCSLLVLLVIRKTETSVLPVLATFSIIFSLSNVIAPKDTALLDTGDPAAKATPGERPKNALLHIVLDAQAPLASEPDMAYAGEVIAGISRAYQDRGFQVYPTVRSVHHQTFKSLTNMVSLSGDMENYFAKDRRENHIKSVRHNMAFARLREQGYQLRVYQSGYLDFCADIEDIECSTYPILDMSVFEASGLSYADRIKVALLAMSRDYMNPRGGRFIGAYRAAAHLVSPPKKSYRNLSWPGKSLEVIGLLRDELETLAPGDAYFAHVLVPHAPFVYDPDCQMKSPADWSFAIRHGRQQVHSAVERAYWDQAACTHRKIMQIVDSVGDKPYLTIIIHGDHGARLFLDTDRTSDTDSLDTYFAIRSSQRDRVSTPSTPVLQELFTNKFNSFIAYD